METIEFLTEHGIDPIVFALEICVMRNDLALSPPHTVTPDPIMGKLAISNN